MWDQFRTLRSYEERERPLTLTGALPDPLWLEPGWGREPCSGALPRSRSPTGVSHVC